MSVDPPPLTTHGLARACGVSPQTVHNWIAYGLPVARTEAIGATGKLRRWHDLAACLKWREDNFPADAAGRGGLRPGAGRRPVVAPPLAPAPTAPPGPPGTKAGMKFDPEGTDVGDAPQKRLKIAQAEGQELANRRKLLELMERQSQLVPLAEVEAEWAVKLRILAQRLDAAPGSAAVAVMAAAGLVGDEVRVMLEGIIRAELDAARADVVVTLKRAAGI